MWHFTQDPVRKTETTPGFSTKTIWSKELVAQVMEALIKTKRGGEATQRLTKSGNHYQPHLEDRGDVNRTQKPQKRCSPCWKLEKRSQKHRKREKERDPALRSLLPEPPLDRLSWSRLVREPEKLRLQKKGEEWAWEQKETTGIWSNILVGEPNMHAYFVIPKQASRSPIFAREFRSHMYLLETRLSPTKSDYTSSMYPISLYIFNLHSGQILTRAH